MIGTVVDYRSLKPGKCRVGKGAASVCDALWPHGAPMCIHAPASLCE